MPRVSPFHVFPHVVIATAPERGHVARDGDRPERWRKQRNGQCDSPISDHGMGRKAIGFLHLAFDQRPAIASVVDRNRSPHGRGPVRWRQPGKVAGQWPVEQGQRCIRQLPAAERVERAFNISPKATGHGAPIVLPSNSTRRMRDCSGSALRSKPNP
jgi:hypothetical protein